MFDRINRRPESNYVLANGVTSVHSNAAHVLKDAKRLIFTGSMGFPPNLQGILWFLDKVFPSVCRRMTDVHVVIAGQDPCEELLARRSPHVHVLGFVADLRAEIARSQLYVAPLISGTGFRNKVVEAIDCGTYVIGSPMALEFLSDQIRSRLLTAANPADFAEGIYRFLSDPRKFDCELRVARQLVQQEYQWSNKAKELEQLCEQELRRSTERSVLVS
jgi:glycosyltransferase involved in cell wall biosynthesis